MSQSPESAAGRFHQATDPLKTAESQHSDNSGRNDCAVGWIGGLNIQSQQGNLKYPSQYTQHDAQACCQRKIDLKNPESLPRIGCTHALAGESNG